MSNLGSNKFQLDSFYPNYFKLFLPSGNMTKEYTQAPVGREYCSDVNTKLRDLEEKQNLLKERILLIGQNLVEDRGSTLEEVQELKKTVLKLGEETLRIKELIKNISEQISEFARKEELMILQRQFDMFKPHLK